MRDMAQTNWKTEFARRWVTQWTAPARPTPGSVAFIERNITSFPKSDPSVLILGSTSEFRDLCFDLKIHPTIVDFSRENYHILSGAMKHKDVYEQNETFVEADWRDMNFAEQFDIILGDAVWNIVPVDSNEQLLHNIRRHLDSHGIYIERIHQVPPEYESMDMVAEVEKRRKDIEQHSLYYVFGTPGYLAVQEYSNESIPLKRVSAWADTLLERGLITQKEWDDFRSLGKHKTDFVFFLPSKQWVDDRASEYFSVKDIFIDYAFPFYPEFYPNYVMAVR